MIVSTGLTSFLIWILSANEYNIFGISGKTMVGLGIDFISI